MLIIIKMTKISFSNELIPYTKNYYVEDLTTQD